MNMSPLIFQFFFLKRVEKLWGIRFHLEIYCLALKGNSNDNFFEEIVYERFCIILLYVCFDQFQT
jgi:hypothetical protein